MKVFWFSGESGLREWIFARSEAHAAELYVELLIMSGAPATNFWNREIKREAVVGKHRGYFDAAVALNKQGFGEFDPNTGWTIIPLAERISQLLRSGT